MEISQVQPGDEGHVQELERHEDRRRDPRIATDDPASMTLVDTWTSARLPIRVLDVSKSGLRLSTPQPLSKGTLLQIHVHGKLAIAEVRYCRSVGSDFHIGVLFESVFSET
jgi:hypothetical protein